MRLGQGLGCCEKQANRTVSRGEASGTAPVGLGGFWDGSRMEDEERTQIPVGSMSREVSTDWSDGTEQSSSHPSPSETVPVAEQSDHVRPLPFHEGALPAYAERHQGGMDHDGLGNIQDVGVEPRSGCVWEAPHPTMTPLFGQHVIDDEHILYRSNGPSYSRSPIGRGPPTPGHFELNFSRPPPPAMPTPASRFAHGFQQSFMEDPRPSGKPINSRLIDVGAVDADSPHLMGGQESSNRDDFISAIWTSSETSRMVDSVGRMSTTRRSTRYAKGIAIPSNSASDIRLSSGTDDQVRRRDVNSDGAISPSSYPLTSPLLPPPTTDYSLDTSAIMFPGTGAVIDGGFRMVPASNNHNEARLTHVHTAFENSNAGWKRHTRVYGGSVCLACAASKDGGFYGSSVRPEDRR